MEKFHFCTLTTRYLPKQNLWNVNQRTNRKKFTQKLKKTIHGESLSLLQTQIILILYQDESLLRSKPFERPTRIKERKLILGVQMGVRKGVVLPNYIILLYLSEVESRIQGLRPRPRSPRPRTALPRTVPLGAKDRNARGQGQGPRAQTQVFSKKSSSKKIFRRSPK